MGPGVDGNQGLAASLWRRPRLQLSLLLAGPIGWLVIAYLGSLAVLFLAAFWQLDTFSGKVVHTYSLQNFETLLQEDVYRSIVLRTSSGRLAGSSFIATSLPPAPGGRADRLPRRPWIETPCPSLPVLADSKLARGQFRAPESFRKFLNHFRKMVKELP